MGRSGGWRELGEVIEGRGDKDFGFCWNGGGRRYWL